MTILPKKKQPKDKNETENRDPPRSPPGESRLGIPNRRQATNSPTRWNNSVLDDPSIDPSGRFEGVHSHDVNQIHNKKRHRSSPHRTGRKHRHYTHQPHNDRQTTRQDRQTPRQIWVDPSPGTSHSSISPLTHSSHLSYGVSGQEGHVPMSENDAGGYNSEDEYSSSQSSVPQIGENLCPEELERVFEAALKEKRGFLIKRMEEDGACLFRAVADQVFGDQEMHSIVRKNCVDYMAKNADYFTQYVTEDFTSYLNRKRLDHCHGNHIEMQAMCEIFNRPIEVYQYSIEPINTFQGAYKTGYEPIRLSYHGNHYNSVVDPMKATIGVGLGLPGFQPGLADRNLLSDAKEMSEEIHIEKAMLDDKMRETDWEVTQESIEEQVARESYLQWLRDQEKRVKCTQAGATASATCSTSTAASADCCEFHSDAPYSGPSPTGPSASHSASPQRLSPLRVNSAAERGHHTPTPPPPAAHLDGATGCVSEEALQTALRLSPPHGSPGHAAPYSSHGAPISPKPSTSSQETCLGEEAAFRDNLSFNPALYGLSDWDEVDIMAQVIARSQQEYMDSLRQQQQQQRSAGSSSAATSPRPPEPSS